MKKVLTLLLSIVASVCFAIGLVGCGAEAPANDDTAKHTHTYSSEWSFDDEYHWHAATCEHTEEVSDKAAHDFEDGFCTVCGAIDVNYVAPEDPEENIVAKVSPQMVIMGLLFNPYTVNVKVDDVDVSVTYSLMEKFIKAAVETDKEDIKILLDETGLYAKNKNEDRKNFAYATIKGLAKALIAEATGFTTDTIKNIVESILPEGFTFEDVVEVFYNDGVMTFDEEKAANIIEGYFNEDVTIDDAITLLSDGVDYEDVETILSENSIAMINAVLPKGADLETLVSYVKNITPENIAAITDGELTVDEIIAILPDGATEEMIDEFLARNVSEDISLSKIVETVNLLIEKFGEISAEEIEIEEDFEVEEENEYEIDDSSYNFIDIDNEAQAKAINFILDTFFSEEETEDGVKYTLNFDFIKNVNKKLNTATIAELIDFVAGEGTVDGIEGIGKVVLNLKISDILTTVKSMYNIDISAILEQVEGYVDQYGPTVEEIVNNLIDTDKDAGEEETTVSLVETAKNIIGMVKFYVTDEEFTAKTVSEAIAYFAALGNEEGGESEITAEKIVEYFNSAITFIKGNTVYDVIDILTASSENRVTAEMIYTMINDFADTLNENIIFDFEINEYGMLNEMNVKVAMEKIDVNVKLGDDVGELFTEDDKQAIADKIQACDISTIEDYYYTTGYSNVGVEFKTEDELLYITRIETYKDDEEGSKSTQETYVINTEDLEDALITIEEEYVEFMFIVDGRKSVELRFTEDGMYLLRDYWYIMNNVA